MASQLFMSYTSLCDAILGCSGDFGTMYSIGERFATSKNSTCYCGEGYSLSCGQSYPVESG